MFNISLDDQLKEYLDNYWLGLEDTNQIDVPTNFLAPKDAMEAENPLVQIARIIRDPANFYFTCKHILNIDLLQYQVIILQELWYHRFPLMIGSRGLGKTFLIAVYCMLRCLIEQGIKIVITGSGFRQSKFVLGYMTAIWQNAPVLRELIGESYHDIPNGPRIEPDRISFQIGSSRTTGIPLGHDGAKVRGERAKIVIADEFASINRDVFETVIGGFAAVNTSPAEKVKSKSRVRAMKKLGIDVPPEAAEGNQIIITGSADYAFGHFCDYWKRYKKILETQGNINKLAEIFGEDFNEDTNWEDYCVIRVPFDLLPEDYIDKAVLSRAKATFHSGTFDCEFGAVFSSDSAGFYPMSQIRGCTCPVETQDGTVIFEPLLKGFSDRKYVIGIDPASESDNFSVVVVELNGNHNRVVYCWTARKDLHYEKLKQGFTKEKNFYYYCARKIRELMRAFPCLILLMDKMGGGVSMREAFADTDKLEDGELPIFPIPDPDDPKPTDSEQGLHILQLVQFAKADWVLDANNFLKKDLEDKTLLFPRFDSIELAMAELDDIAANRQDDTIEKCIMEIEELKNELASIVHTYTGVSGRDRFDVPEIKLPGGKKGKQRKDRYSALLMANMGARNIQRAAPVKNYESVGGFADSQKKSSGDLYIGKTAIGKWFSDNINRMPNYGGFIRN